MILRRLRLAGWRNLQPAVIEPGPHATVFFGENGQGKTNVVEAVYYLTEFRSFRTKVASDLLQWGQEGARLEGEVVAAGLDRQIQVTLQDGRRLTRVDGKAARRDSEALRGISVVLFVPEDLLLPKAAPAARRSFLDRAIFGVDRAYWGEAVAFLKTLKSRNALLRERRAGGSLLETYDEAMARTGARVVMRRRQLVRALAPRVAHLFEAIHGALAVDAIYQGHEEVQGAQAEGEVEAALLAGLQRRHARDLARGFSGFGPHMDDLELRLEGHLVRQHGSQGQVRSLVLALKLAELGHIQEARGESPLLLLDDVASELDEIRRTRLFETIAALPGQTLITVTDRNFLPRLPGRLDIQVTGGVLSPLPS